MTDENAWKVFGSVGLAVLFAAVGFAGLFIIDMSTTRGMLCAVIITICILFLAFTVGRIYEFATLYDTPNRAAQCGFVERGLR